MAMRERQIIFIKELNESEAGQTAQCGTSMLAR